MTGFLVLRQSTVDGLSTLKRKMLDVCMRDTRLAESPSTIKKAGVVAYCYGTTMWDEDGMALLGALGANLAWVNAAVMRADFDDEHGKLLRAFIFGLLAGGGKLVLPENVPESQSGNRLQDILTAQGVPQNQVRFYTGHPIDTDGWAVYPTPAPEEPV